MFAVYLKTHFDLIALDISVGEGLPDKFIFSSDIFTLRPRIADRSVNLKVAALGKEHQLRYRIRGTTDWCFQAGWIGGNRRPTDFF